MKRISEPLVRAIIAAYISSLASVLGYGPISGVAAVFGLYYSVIALNRILQR